MYAERWQGGHLVEAGVVACAFAAVESQFGHFAKGTGRAHVAHIAEAPAHVDIHTGGATLRGSIAYQIQGHGIHEVGAVGSLEERKEHAVCPRGTALAWGEGYARDYMGLAQVKPHPLEVGAARRITGADVAVEGPRGTLFVPAADDAALQEGLCPLPEGCVRPTQKQCGQEGTGFPEHIH